MSIEGRSSSQPGFQAIYLGSAQKIVTSSGAVGSVPFQTATTLIRLFCTQDCFISIGLNAVATTSSTFMPAGIIEYFGVSAGFIVSSLQVSTGGILYISEGYG